MEQGFLRLQRGCIVEFCQQDGGRRTTILQKGAVGCVTRHKVQLICHTLHACQFLSTRDTSY